MLKLKNIKKLKWVLFPLLFLGLLWLASLFFVINTTDSMPKGLYFKTSPTDIQRGDIVLVCLSDSKANKAIEAGYLITNNQCANGSESLVKRVIAIPDDHVTVTNTYMIINKTVYPATRYLLSPTGKPVIKFIKAGTYRSKGYWLYGASDFKYSWDSRYFGEVPRSGIKNILKPLLLATPNEIMPKKGYTEWVK